MSLKMSESSRLSFFFTLLISCASMAAAGLLPAPARAADSVKLETLKTHTRIVFHVDENTPVETKTDTKGFELFFKGISLSDLGAPLGEEEGWKAQFAKIQDPRLASLAFSEMTGGVKVSGKWKFPSGPSAPAKPAMDWFDYREKEPSPRFVADFWHKGGPTIGEIRAAKKEFDKRNSLKKAEDDAKKRVERRLASHRLKAEIEDITKFCREPLAEASDVFLPFLPVHEKMNFSEWFPATTADAKFTYYSPKSNEKDAQYVRLAQDLYKQGKPALVIRTIDFFENEHPGSSYRHEMRFLRANALIRLGYPDDAERVLTKLMAEAQDSPVALHAAMYLAGKQFARGNHLASLETFLWLINRYSEHQLNWVFHFGAAESLYSLKQAQRAAKEYQWVVENAADRKYQASAALRLGDLYLDRYQYEQALATYFQSMNRFAAELPGFPAVQVNRAEALYGLKEFDRAKEAFTAFLKAYPNHPYGWRASFRLGEIEGRKVAQGDDSRKWFYETINRYPFSPGATLSRLRLIPCGDHGGFDYNAAVRFFDGEATNFSSAEEVSLGSYADFKGLAQVRALITFDKPEQALDVAINELQANRHPEVRPVLTALLGGLFRRSIIHLLDDGKRYEALTYYTQKSKWVKKESPDVDPDYLLRLSQTASDLGLGKLAIELTNAYESVTTMALAPGAHAPAGHISSDPNDMETQLRRSEHHYSVAKGLWVTGTEGHEDKIRAELAQMVEQSPFSAEKELMLGLLEERAANLNSALAHAMKAQVLLPETDVMKQDLSLQCWIAGLEAKVGDPDVALGVYRDLEARARLKAKYERPAMAAIYGIPPLPALDQVMMAQAEIHEKRQHWGEAAAVYMRMVEIQKPASQALFSYARALMKSGDAASKAKAIGVLEKLAGPPPKKIPGVPQARVPASKDDDFWKKLAREALEGEEVSKLMNAKEGMSK